jgi:hypothetical protein
MKKENKYLTPSIANLSANNATIGEISIIPIGGMIRLNGSKKGSTSLPTPCPKADSRAFGSHDIKIYIIHINQ